MLNSSQSTHHGQCQGQGLLIRKRRWHTEKDAEQNASKRRNRAQRDRIEHIAAKKTRRKEREQSE